MCRLVEAGVGEKDEVGRLQARGGSCLSEEDGAAIGVSRARDECEIA